MSRNRAIFVAAAAFAALLAAAAAYVYFVLFSAQAIVSRAEAIALEKTGRALRVAGPAKLRKGWSSTITVSDVTFANPDWTENPVMMAAARVEIRFRPLSLIFGPAIIEEAVIAEPEIAFIREDEHGGNWRFGDDASGRSAGADIPIIKRLKAQNGRIGYRGRTGRRDIDLRIETLISRLDGARARTELSGALQREPLRAAFSHDDWRALRADGAAFALDGELTVGALSFALAGAAREPLRLQGLDFALTMQGDDLASLSRYTAISFPDTPEYALEGRLSRDGDPWRYEIADGLIGESDVRGFLSITQRPERPFLQSEINSRALRLTDIRGLLGLKPQPAGAVEDAASEEGGARDEVAGDFFSAEPFELSRFSSMDAQLRLAADAFHMGEERLDGLSALIRLEDARLQFAPLSFVAREGEAKLWMTLDATTTTPSADFRARTERMRVDGLFPPIKEGEPSRAFGSARISTTGASPAQMYLAADGGVRLYTEGGEIRHLVMEAIGLDLAEAIGLVVSEDKPLPIRCAGAAVRLSQGAATLEGGFLDTDDTVLFADGAMTLNDLHVDARIAPHPKDFSAFSMKTGIAVEGPIGEPSIFPDPLEIGSEGFFAKLANAIATPIAGLLPPFDVGDGESPDCAAARDAAMTLERDAAAAFSAEEDADP